MLLINYERDVRCKFMIGEELGKDDGVVKLENLATVVPGFEGDDDEGVKRVRSR